MRWGYAAALASVAVAVNAQFGSQERFIFTTNAGMPVDQPVTSLTLGNRGPVLMQDTLFIEHMQIHNRQIVPERTVHARGSGAKGYFRLTNDMSELTIADVFNGRGKVTPIAVRLSTTGHGKDSPEFIRDGCGFGIKFYTEQGNYDLVGLQFPVFFMRDGNRLPEMSRALRVNQVNGVADFSRFFDFMANFPESMHAATFLLDDIGNPTNWREMSGSAVHTWKWLSASGKETWVRYTWTSNTCQDPDGCGFETDAEAEEQFFAYRTVDLFNAIDEGKEVSWTLFIQTLDPSNRNLVAGLGFDPLDATKVWPTETFPLREVGRFFLTENLVSQHLENELIAFAPSRLVPGIEPSDDKLLHARLYAYTDAQVYRLGVNHQMLQINRPKCTYFDMHWNGNMNFADDLSVPSLTTKRVNYFPSATTSKLQPAPAFPHSMEQISGEKVRQDLPTQDIGDFQQPGDRIRRLPVARQERLAQRFAMALSEPRVANIVRETILGFLGQIDATLVRNTRNFIERLRQGMDRDLASSFARMSGTPP